MPFTVDFETGDTTQVSYDGGLNIDTSPTLGGTYCAYVNSTNKYGNIEFTAASEKTLRLKILRKSELNFNSDYESAYFLHLAEGNQTYDAGWLIYLRRFGDGSINRIGVLKTDYSINDEVQVFTADEVHTIEIDYKAGSGDGHFILKVDDVERFNYGSLNNAGEDMSCLHFGLISGADITGGNLYFDDITDDVGGGTLIETDYDTSIVITKTISQQRDYDTSIAITKTITQQTDYDTSLVITKTITQQTDYDTSLVITKTITQQTDYDTSLFITKTIAQQTDYDTSLVITKTITQQTDYDTSLVITKTIAQQTDYDTSLVITKTITQQTDYDTSITITKGTTLSTDYDTSITITKTLLQQVDYDTALLITKTILQTRDYDTSVLITKLTFDPALINPREISAPIGYNGASSQAGYNRPGSIKGNSGALADPVFNYPSANLEVDQ